MEPANPYAPPTADLGPDPAQVGVLAEAAQRARRGRVAWLVLFGLNLIVPGFLAGAIDSKGIGGGAGLDKWLGIALAVLLLGGMGWGALVARPALTGVAVRGATLMALAQFFPVAQFAAGMLGVGLAMRLPEVGTRTNSQLGPLRGFAATVVTGGALLAASVVVGFILRGVGRFFQGPTAPLPRSTR